uniref:Uncharacterized protein n=1 Tax=viral metagenome TaxID=1070528 RepID=A0A6C0LZB5_9ZZZZ
MSEKKTPIVNKEETILSKSECSQNVLTNLKILANIKPNDKLSKNEHGILIIDSPYIGQGAVRWWYSDSRDESIKNLEGIINETFNLIDSVYSSEVGHSNGNDIENNYYYKHSLPKDYFKSENSQQLQTFSIELKNSIKGLENLKLTYKDDISVCSRIDVLIEKINIRIKKVNGLLTINTINTTK